MKGQPDVSRKLRTLAGHNFEHEIALAVALGIFGSIDINRGDYLTGWDTDQFAMNVPEMTLALYEMLKAGGFTTGGLAFDAKIRRRSLDADDLLYADLGSMDAIARGQAKAHSISPAVASVFARELMLGECLLPPSGKIKLRASGFC